MIFDDEKDEIVFETTGRREYAFSGIFGIGDGYFGDNPSVYYGSDGGVDTSNFTQGERRELADYVISKWVKFKEEE